jgi:epoxyqueuosine reductase
VQAVVADGLPLAELATKAGLGTIGKNSLLQSYDHGSWVMLAGVLTDIESPSSEAEGCRCGSCQACLRLCPTHAISRPFSVDGRLCLLGILGSGDMISHELREAIGKRVISCDACLEVCPRNKFVQPAPVRSEDRFGTWTRSPDLRSLAMLGEDEYQRHFASLDWGKDGRFLLRRNAIIALGNCGETGARQLLVDILQDPDPRLRGYAAWALGQLHDTSARERLEAGLLEERDAFAGEEMRSALVRLSEE